VLNEAEDKNRVKKLSDGNSFFLFSKCGGAKIKSLSGRFECRLFFCLLSNISIAVRYFNAKDK
jgi:hypothetical protein